MRLKIVIVLMVFGIFMLQKTECQAESIMHHKDSRELQLQDVLMVYLNDSINDDVNNYYQNYLTGGVSVYPYLVDLLSIERLNEFRGFDFKVVIEAIPVVGPHISVGKDRLTYEISFLVPRKVKLLKYEHLKTDALPPHWQNIIKKPVRNEP